MIRAWFWNYSPQYLQFSLKLIICAWLLCTLIFMRLVKLYIFKCWLTHRGKCHRCYHVLNIVLIGPCLNTGTHLKETGTQKCGKKTQSAERSKYVELSRVELSAPPANLDHSLDYISRHAVPLPCALTTRIGVGTVKRFIALRALCSVCRPCIDAHWGDVSPGLDIITFFAIITVVPWSRFFYWHDIECLLWC